jgi:hypothetical protein
MTITAPTPVVSARPVATAPLRGAAGEELVDVQPMSERALATWTHLGPAFALVAALVLWPAAALVLVIPASLLLTAARTSPIVREHAAAAMGFILTTLAVLGVALAAIALVGPMFSPLITVGLIVGALLYLGIFLVRAGLAAHQGRAPVFPAKLSVLD